MGRGVVPEKLRAKPAAFSPAQFRDTQRQKRRPPFRVGCFRRGARFHGRADRSRSAAQPLEFPVARVRVGAIHRASHSKPPSLHQRAVRNAVPKSKRADARVLVSKTSAALRPIPKPTDPGNPKQTARRNAVLPKPRANRYNPEARKRKPDRPSALRATRPFARASTETRVTKDRRRRTRPTI